MTTPPRTRQNDASDVESIDDEDEDKEDQSVQLRDEYTTEVIDTKIWGKPAADHPEHERKVIWDGWKQLCELRVQEGSCNPDSFYMYIYNDFEAYRIMALVEKQGSCRCALRRRWC